MMSRVNGLFLDYDGILNALEMPGSQSRILSHLEALLNRIYKSIPIGVITFRDLSFILPRTRFAHAWCAIGGLEIKIDSQLFVSHGVGDVLPFLNQSLRYAKRVVRDGAVIEERRDYSGQPMAFSVDWREVKDEKTARLISSKILTYCKSLPLNIIDYPGKRYFEVFPFPVDKGKALKELKDDMNLAGGVLYIGDLQMNNTAYQEADIGICICNEEPLNPVCEYWMKPDGLPGFLTGLYKNQLLFNDNLSGIRVSGITVPA